MNQSLLRANEATPTDFPKLGAHCKKALPFSPLAIKEFTQGKPDSVAEFSHNMLQHAPKFLPAAGITPSVCVQGHR